MRKTVLGLKLSVLLGSLSLASCAMTGGYQSDEYRLPEGSTVELMEELELSPNATRVFIQDGAAMRGDAVNRWSPYCSFGLNRNRDGRPLTREIEPTRFATGKTRIGVHASRETAPFEQLAFNGVTADLRIASSSGNGSFSAGTPWPYTYYTEVELYSEDAPQVDDLTCSFDGGPVDRNLTVDEMRSTLGDLVRIY